MKVLALVAIGVMAVTQTNNCTLVYCSNSGDNSKQTTNCIGKEDVFHQAGGSCDNQGSGSTQTVNCVDVGSQPPSGDCGNLGDQSTQSITCARMERGCSSAVNPAGPSKQVSPVLMGERVVIFG